MPWQKQQARQQRFLAIAQQQQAEDAREARCRQLGHLPNKYFSRPGDLKRIGECWTKTASKIARDKAAAANMKTILDSIASPFDGKAK